MCSFAVEFRECLSGSVTHQRVHRFAVPSARFGVVFVGLSLYSNCWVLNLYTPIFHAQSLAEACLTGNGFSMEVLRQEVMPKMQN